MDWQETLLLAGALRAGIVDEVAREGGGDARAVARETGSDARATAQVLAALADLGYLEIAADEGAAIGDNAGVDVNAPRRAGLPIDAGQLETTPFRLSDEGRGVLIDEGDQRFERWAILHEAALIEHWLQIPEIIKTGVKPERPKKEEFVSAFLGAMDTGGRHAAESVVDKVLSVVASHGLTEPKTVLDLGGATGRYARAFTARGLAATMMDTPATIERVEDSLANDGIAIFAGDFFETLPPGPFDIVFASSISHIYGPDDHKNLLRRLRDIVSPGGFLVIVDFVRGVSDRAPLFAINMLVHTERGSTWTEGDYRSWVTGAGFKEPAFEEISPGGRVAISALRATSLKA